MPDTVSDHVVETLLDWGVTAGTTNKDELES
jgi:hypothetical protein